jgi:phytanoyl-CoA hydroxylase
MALSAAERDHYWRVGYVLVRGLVDAETLARLDARFEALVTGEVPAPADMVIMKDVAFVKGGATAASPLHAINKILSFESDPVLWPFAAHEPMLERVREIAGPELVTLSTNLFNKPPGVDGRHPMHQDLRYFSIRPADRIVATWTAIDRCTRENGCLAVIPGSHRSDLAEHANPDWELVNYGFFAARGVDLEARVHVEMEPGDTLFFHPLLVHGSGRNRSEDFRRAISVHYASAECARPGDTQGRRPGQRRIRAAMKPVLPLERTRR